MAAIIVFMAWLAALACGWVELMDAALYLPLTMIMAATLHD